MSVRDQFQAAVKVIQGLPKEGSYQPSHSLMLRFYGLYKQATEGACNLGSRPPFWDPVRRAKYDAWRALGDMRREEAMALYVEEIKKIIETMSFSTDVAELTEVLGPFYEYVAEGEEEGKEGDHGEEEEEEGEEEEDKMSDSGIDVGAVAVSTALPLEREDREDAAALKAALGKYEEEEQGTKDDYDDEDFGLRGEALLQEMLETKEQVARVTEQLKKGRSVQDLEEEDGSDSTDGDDDVYEDPLVPEDLIDQPRESGLVATSQKVDEAKEVDVQVAATIQSAVNSLNKEVEHILARVANLEDCVYRRQSGEKGEEEEEEETRPRHVSLSTTSFAFLVVWPFLAQGIVRLASSLRKAS